MKKWSVNLMVLAMGLSIFLGNPPESSAQTQGSSKSSLVGIGIRDFFDEEIHFNHNQLFKKLLKENPVFLNSKPAVIDLVEHQSQAEIVIDAKLTKKSLVARYFKGGKLVSRDTVFIPAMEVKKIDHYSTSFSVLKSDAGFILTGLSTEKKDYQKGLRDGFILQEILGKSVKMMSEEEVKGLLRGATDSPVSIKVVNQETGQIISYTALKNPVYSKEWDRPMTIDHMELIAQAFLKSIYTRRDSLNIVFKNGPVFSKKCLRSISPDHNSGKCFSYEQFSTCAESKMHFLEPGVDVSPVFLNEKFYVPKKKNKNWAPGDASLNVMRYYNFEQNESYLSKNGNISEDVKSAIQKLSGPFYNKAGVFANYYIAAKEYENAGNFRAALNQYYASLRKIDDIIASERTKIRAKYIVTSRIGHCAKKLNQNQYSDLMLLARDCLAFALNDEGVKKANDNFYDFSSQVLKLSFDLESKLKQQRSEKTWAVVNAVVNAAAGVASLALDAGSGLSSLYLLSAADAIDQNQKFNSQMNLFLWEITSSMQFNLPPELEEEDNNPYEILASRYVNFALESSVNKGAILNQILRYAEDKPSLKRAAKKVLEDFQNGIALDHNNLMKELLRYEVLVYRSEKKGLEVPEMAVLP